MTASLDWDDPPQGQYAGLSAVLSLARTCRCLHEFALNAIWHTIPSVAPLVYTLPKDALEPFEDPGLYPEDYPRTRMVREASSAISHVFSTASSYEDLASPSSTAGPPSFQTLRKSCEMHCVISGLLQIPQTGTNAPSPILCTGRFRCSIPSRSLVTQLTSAPH